MIIIKYNVCYNFIEVDMKNRNYGIDLLKIISMIMIPILHVLGQGGLLNNSAYFSTNYYIFWILEICCYCAVNSYAMISGYLEYGKKIKFSNLIYLYLEVLFYSLIILLLYFIFDRNVVGVKNIINSVFVVSRNSYWYFSSYFVMFFFLPFINNFTEKVSRKEYKSLLIIIFVLFSLLPTLFRIDFSVLGLGYSPLWLLSMYLFGSYIKKYDVKIFNKNNKHLLWYFICCVMTILSKYIIEFLTFKVFGSVHLENYLIEYNSPTILFCSIFLLIYFSNIKIGEKISKIIAFFVPLSFAVYIIHVNQIIWNNNFKDAFIWISKYNFIIEVLLVFGCALAIWLVCSLIDKIRLIIFNKLKVKDLSIKLEDKFIILYNKLVK